MRTCFCFTCYFQLVNLRGRSRGESHEHRRQGRDEKRMDRKDHIRDMASFQLRARKEKNKKRNNWAYVRAYDLEIDHPLPSLEAITPNFVEWNL